MKWVVIASALLLAACSPAERMSYQVRSIGTGYDTIKDEKIPGAFRTQGVYDPNDTQVSADEVKWRTLWNGLQTAQNAGYDLATFAGPASTMLTRTITHTSTRTSYTAGQYPGFVYLVRGYKSGGEHPANARPITALMDEANRRAFAAKKP